MFARCGDGGIIAARRILSFASLSNMPPFRPLQTPTRLIFHKDQHLHADVIQVSAQIVGQERHPAVMSAEQRGAQGILTTSHGFKRELPCTSMIERCDYEDSSGL